MRKQSQLVVLLIAVMILTGCAMAMTPVTGMWYLEVKGPVTATSNATFSKVGTSSATSILGLVGTGDASIDAAMRNGGISKVSHVDYETKAILGIFAEIKVHVYGD